MTTIINAKRSGLVAGTAAALALAAVGFAGVAQARDNVSISLGIGVPGVAFGVTNAYPVYTQPAPVYYQPAPVYYQPAPIYVQPRPVFVQPRPYYYGPPQVVYTHPGYRNGWHGRRGHGHDRDDDNRGYRQQYRPGYGPVYYQR